MSAETATDRIASLLESFLCARHQATMPTRQPCAACTQDADELVVVLAKALAGFAAKAKVEEPCEEFGQHPVGGHAEAARIAWAACSSCGSARQECNDADQCCEPCRSTAGLTHPLFGGDVA